MREGCGCEGGARTRRVGLEKKGAVWLIDVYGGALRCVSSVLACQSHEVGTVEQMNDGGSGNGLFEKSADARQAKRSASRDDNAHQATPLSFSGRPYCSHANNNLHETKTHTLRPA